MYAYYMYVYIYIDIIIFIDIDERTSKWMIFGDAVDSGCVISCNYFGLGKLSCDIVSVCVYMYIYMGKL